MNAPPSPKPGFVLDLSSIDFGPEPDPEPEGERFARMLAGDRDGDDIAWLAADRDRSERFRSRLDERRRAAATQRAGQERRAREEQERRAVEYAAERAARRATIDRTPFLDALRVVALDPVREPGRNRLSALVDAVEQGQWFGVRIICPNPQCKAPNSVLSQSDHDGSLLVSCGGKRRGEETIECAGPVALTAMVEALVDDLRDEDEEQCGVLPPMINLADLLAEPVADHDLFLIDRLWPKSGRVLFGGPSKAGKTTGVDNALRSLVDGVPFLGEFAVRQAVTRAVVIDLELTHEMSRDWFGRLGFAHPERVDVIAMRGLARMLDLSDPSLRSEWVERLRGADVVVLDCLNPVLDALGLHVTQVTRFLNLLDEVLIEAGVPHAMVVHHHNDDEQIGGGNKVRGWSDALWNTLMLDRHDPASPRFFVAQVRGGGVDEGRLGFDPETGALTYEGGTRAEAATAARSSTKQARATQERAERKAGRAEDHLRLVAALAADEADSWTAGDIASLLAEHTDLSSRRVKDARIKAVRIGLVSEQPGPGNSKVYALTPEARTATPREASQP